MGNVTVTLLGGFSVAVDGQPVDDGVWRLRKARELVKLLALAPGHRLHREQVMDLLWRDRAPSAAANNLHQAVHVARRALGADSIRVRDGLLTLSAEVDADRLEDMAAEARRKATPAAYRAALALYLGELLPENRYDEWAEQRREELSELAIALKAELSGIGSDVQPALSLPSETSSFIGRQRELGELRALLAGTRLLTLVGTGGVGKTTLALRLARGAESAYGGAALVDFGVLSDPALVPEAVAAALDVRALSGQSPLDAVIAYLSGQPLLLVLDNCEHLLASVAGIAADLLRGAPGLTIVATSRAPLAAPGEVVFRVPSLDIPDPDLGLTPDQLRGYAAVRLFTERAQAAHPGFELDADNALDVARICFRLDGVPLALELAAGRLGALGPALIAERLDDRFRLLRSVGHASPTRQHTLAATLDWSHDLLDGAERVLFRRLAAFAGSFDLQAVEGVCPDEHLPVEDIPDLLARLVEQSLVSIDEPSARERRYRLLETVRLYAQDRLDEANETPAVRDAHARWALALAEAKRGAPHLDRDAANLRAALDTLLDRHPDEALALSTALLPFWMRRIDLLEAGRRFDRALATATERSTARARALLAAASIDLRSGELARGHRHVEESYALAVDIGDTRTQWRTLQFHGELSIAHDDAEVARRSFEQGLELARREGFASAEATGVYSLGIVQWVLGNLTSAEAFLDDAAKRFTALAGSPERIPSPLNFAETSQPGTRVALRTVFEDTLQPFVEMSCEAAVGHVLANQAGVVRARGDLARARVLLDESVARFRDSGDELGVAAAFARRAYLELADDAPGAARDALEQALDIRRRHRDRRGVGLALTGLGLIDTLAGAYADAEEHLSAACAMFRRAGDRWGLTNALWRVADLAFARGRLDEAERALEEAQAVIVPTQRERWIANTLAGLAEVALQRGDTDLARALLSDARERYAARQDALGVAAVEQRLAEVANGVLRPVKEAPRTTPLTS